MGKITEQEHTTRKALGDEYRTTQELQRHEEAIRHIRFTINILIQREKAHQEKIAELKLKGGSTA